MSEGATIPSSLVGASPITVRRISSLKGVLYLALYLAGFVLSTGMLCLAVGMIVVPGFYGMVLYRVFGLASEPGLNMLVGNTPIANAALNLLVVYPVTAYVCLGGVVNTVVMLLRPGPVFAIGENGFVDRSWTHGVGFVTWDDVAGEVVDDNANNGIKIGETTGISMRLAKPEGFKRRVRGFPTLSRAIFRGVANTGCWTIWRTKWVASEDEYDRFAAELRRHLADSEMPAEGLAPQRASEAPEAATEPGASAPSLAFDPPAAPDSSVPGRLTRRRVRTILYWVAVIAFIAGGLATFWGLLPIAPKAFVIGSIVAIIALSILDRLI